MADTREELDTELNDLLMRAWGLVANAGGGDWKKETGEWQTAAVDWRERYNRYLDQVDREEE